MINIFQDNLEKLEKVAKKTDVAFTLTLNQYIEILKKRCHYCKTGIFRKKTGYGLDLMDPTLGYIKSNLLPCCTRCKDFRRNFVSPDHFKQMMELYLKLVKKQKKVESVAVSKPPEVSEEEKKVEIKDYLKKGDLPKEDMTKALQFFNIYLKMKDDFFKVKNLEKPTLKIKDLNYFIKALYITRNHQVTIKDFIKAQIFGLRFINNGLGAFPSFSQLATSNAEIRLLEYIKIQKLEGVQLSPSDKTQDLMSNSFYKNRHKKIKLRTATLIEALYVKECQLEKRGEVQKIVLEYIKQLKSKI